MPSKDKPTYDWFKVVGLTRIKDSQTRKLCDNVRKGNHNPMVKLSNPTEYFIRKKVNHDD